MDRKINHIAPTAIIRGDVTLGEDCSVWYGAVMRGDGGPIRIGDRSNIQDNAVVHDETTIGCDCTVGHCAIVHGCTIGDRCLIGMGSIILNGAVIGDDCIVGAGALVTGKTVAPPRSMLLGSPAKVVRSLNDDELAAILENSEYYVNLSRETEKKGW